MFIDSTLCERCMDCRPLCPVGAIRARKKEVVIVQDECVECGTCFRYNICPNSAIKQLDEIPYPRIVRAHFSDPAMTHESIDVCGRGTEEMKTNDVTHSYTEDQIGFSVELGRPGVGTRLYELEKVVQKATSMGVDFAEDNPVYPLIIDHSTGKLRPEVLNEKVLSAIAEFTVKRSELLSFISELIPFFNNQIETVVTVSLIARCDKNGRVSVFEELERNRIAFYPNGKVNLGLANI